MHRKLVVVSQLVIFGTLGCWAQNDEAKAKNVPIYRVTVIERTVRAVDYQYRNGPTKVDFRGTVLLPQAKGEATVESKRGRTEIDARLEHVPPPTRFGREYLTYVLWAITPEGHARNLGEVLADGSDHARLRVTTDLQAFGLIVTAEPYSAVRQPSDVVVLENEIRPDTVGKTEPVQAKYELLPRGHYTYNVPAAFSAAEGAAPKVPFDQYEGLVEVYQAQNAVQIARAAGADKYAADTYAKAEKLLHDAQDLQARKAGVSVIVTTARQAAQTAEDARAIALRHGHDAEVEQARAQAAAAQQKQAEAEAAAAQARGEAEAARAQLEQERATREADRVVPAAATMPQAAPIQEPQRTPEPAAPPAEEHQRQTRVRLYQQLSAVLPTRDTPRGLVVTVADGYFHSTTIAPALYGKLAGIASILRSHPGLTVEVEGHTDDHGDPGYLERLSLERATAIRNLLTRQGVAPAAVFARGFGKTRPLGPNGTPAEREQNRRVEIVISGSAIGGTPMWDRSYGLPPGR